MPNDIEDGPWTVTYGEPFLITVPDREDLSRLMDRVGGTLHVQNMYMPDEPPCLCRVDSITGRVVTFKPITFHVE